MYIVSYICQSYEYYIGRGIIYGQKKVKLSCEEKSSRARGEEVCLKFIGDRNKVHVFNGVVLGAYPSLFTVRIYSEERVFVKSFMYTDFIVGRLFIKKTGA